MVTRKKNIQKVLFPFFSLFLLFQSYKLLKMIWELSIFEFSLFTKLLVVILINLFVTGVFAFIGFVYSTNLLIGEGYYRVKDPAKLMRLSSFLKLKYFKMFLLFVFWGRQKNRKKYFDGTRQGVENFEYQTRQSEFGHLMSFIMIMLVTVLMLVKGQYFMALITTILNIISNFYPIILQRNHRVRIERMKNLMNRKTDRQKGI